MVVRTHLLFNKRKQKAKAEEEDTIVEEDAHEQIIEKSSKQVLRARLRSNDKSLLWFCRFLNETLGRLRERCRLLGRFRYSQECAKDRDALGASEDRSVLRRPGRQETKQAFRESWRQTFAVFLSARLTRIFA